MVGRSILLALYRLVAVGKARPVAIWRRGEVVPAYGTDGEKFVGENNQVPQGVIAIWSALVGKE